MLVNVKNIKSSFDKAEFEFEKSNKNKYGYLSINFSEFKITISDIKSCKKVEVSDNQPYIITKIYIGEREYVKFTNETVTRITNNQIQNNRVNNNESNTRFFIPKNTLEALKKSKIIKDEEFLDTNINPALVLGKYSDGNMEKGDKKKIRFQEFISVFKKSDSKIYEILNKKQAKIKSLYSSKEFQCQTSWRLVVGMGTESVYENSMTFHHAYSIPYIPASAIKGAIRSYTILEYFDAKEKKALEDPIFKTIFGDEEHQGNIIFFDTYPTEKPTIELDIMNNHYKDYYEKKASTPQENKDPVPLFFISITKGNFKFLLSENKSIIINKKTNSILEEEFKDKKILEIAEELMKKALTEGGIGAKTSSGYGYMVYDT